jgi:pterin-4a-carbinolamine dehydratase
MSDMTLDEYSSVIEDLSRWQLAEQWADQIKRGKLTKKQVFEKFADAPHAYVEDMVAKMKEKLKEKPNGG